MKRIMIGDIHGRNWWLDVIKENDDADEFIFFGDYFDPYADNLDYEGALGSVDELISNFNKIIEFKESNESRVKLLLGNHDLHYIADVRPCSRYNPRAAKRITNVIMSKIHLFDVVFQFENVLCTHAGISWAWLEKYRQNWEVANVAAIVRELFEEDPKFFDYDGRLYPEQIVEVGHIYESPMWIRPYNLDFACQLDNRLTIEYIQVFGHTKLFGIPLEQAVNNVNHYRKINVDTLWGFEPRYLCYQDGLFSYKRVGRNYKFAL